MISIFEHRVPVRFTGLEGDPQPGVAYHFDAIARLNMDLSTTYTSYPIQFGADVQDSAYNNPDKLIIVGYTGAKELRFSVNQLPELGASAVVGNINNAGVSAVAGIVAEASSAWLGSDEAQTRPQATLEFLKELKEGFRVFDVITELMIYRRMKIDRITSEINETNESGLEFILELSQLRMAGLAPQAKSQALDLPESDPARTQSAPILERGLISFE